MKFEKQKTDSGISPVVGVILMVAITVILSAIIATFVLDLGGSVGQNPAAGVTFDQYTTQNADDTNIEVVDVSVVSMENADEVGVSDDYGNSKTMSGVGDTVTIEGDEGDPDGDSTNEKLGYSNGDTITVTATLDGKTTVTQSYTVQG